MSLQAAGARFQQERVGEDNGVWRLPAQEELEPIALLATVNRGPCPSRASRVSQTCLFVLAGGCGRGSWGGCGRVGRGEGGCGGGA